MRDREESVDIDRMPEGMHRHERPDDPSRSVVDELSAVQLRAAHQVRAQRNGIHAEGALLAVDEVGRRAAIDHRVRRCNEAQSGHEHFVPGFHPGESQTDVQRRSTVHDGHHVLCPSICSQLRLEAVDPLADRRDKRAVEALLEVRPLIAGEARLMKRDRACASHVPEGVHYEAREAGIRRDSLHRL
jgi:hypothetical protein